MTSAWRWDWRQRSECSWDGMWRCCWCRKWLGCYWLHRSAASLRKTTSVMVIFGRVYIHWVLSDCCVVCVA